MVTFATVLTVVTIVSMLSIETTKTIVTIVAIVTVVSIATIVTANCIYYESHFVAIRRINRNFEQQLIIIIVAIFTILAIVT